LKLVGVYWERGGDEGNEGEGEGEKGEVYPTVDVTQFRPEETPLLLLFDDDMIG